MTNKKGDFADFTETGYAKLIKLASRRHAFEPFGTECAKPHALWRHDVDHSVHRALSFAAIEEKAGVRATYFYSLHSDFYNLLEKPVFEIAAKTLEMGHHLGLHFDATFYGGFRSAKALDEAASFERDILAKLFGVKPSAISFHNPGVVDIAGFSRDTVGGMVNTYGKSVASRYRYCSDSNGFWRHERLFDVIAGGNDERLHVLTHPEWWQKKPMPPRERIQRCADGRAKAQLKLYDETLRKYGRKNIR